MISVGDLIFFLSKQTLLRISQMAQQKAAKPTICNFGFLGINFSHQNQNCSVFVGLQSALITHAVRLQAYLARVQSKKQMDYVFIFITELTMLVTMPIFLSYCPL
jgi:hypothetical protein